MKGLILTIIKLKCVPDGVVDFNPFLPNVPFSYPHENIKRQHWEEMS